MDASAIEICLQPKWVYAVSLIHGYKPVQVSTY